MKNFDFKDYFVVLGKGGRMITSKSGDYHFAFKTESGFTCKFGNEISDDVEFSPWGNEIADIEITTSCRGIRDSEGNRAPCKFCYKGNSECGKYMTFQNFKKVFDLLNQPKTMTQIAFGVDAECKGNPDVWKIMDYCLENNVIPNVTVADIDAETAENIVKRCGACSVSAYQRDKNRCYDSVALLKEKANALGKNNFQVNIHLLVSHETKDFCKEVIEDAKTDLRLKDLGAIVLLSLKQKGRGINFSKIEDGAREQILDLLMNQKDGRKINFGMDSCGANFFLKYLDEKGNRNKYENFVESCESLLFSIYVNVDGKVFPCSFMEGEKDCIDGIDLLSDSISDFTNDVWNNSRVLEWRNKAIENIHKNGCNSCPYFNV